MTPELLKELAENVSVFKKTDEEWLLLIDYLKEQNERIIDLESRIRYLEIDNGPDKFRKQI